MSDFEPCRGNARGRINGASPVFACRTTIPISANGTHVYSVGPKFVRG